MAAICNGWHKFRDIDVFVSNGYILFGKKGDALIHPYHKDKHGWYECIGVSYSAAYNAYRKGNLKFE